MSDGAGRVAGKVAVVSGASSGIGRATFELLGREGAKVVGTARREELLKEALDEVVRHGGEGIVVPADLEESGTAEKVVRAALDEYGRVDILVCNAGVGWQYGEEHPGTMAALHEVSLENWQDVIGGVDLQGYFEMMRAALPSMIEAESGAIVNISSMAGITGLYDAHPYTAAKGAIVNLGRSLAITYGKQGIRTNTVCPGFIDTAMIAPVVGAFDDPEVAAALVPMKRPGRPEEIANAVLFLASDDASYVNGSVLVVDGGCTSRSFAA
ncbi:MAG TPA: SDR family NAD(P)-dependent oxidoreductase [Solirubrobacterales bacterium]|nr:SDR family NAD(P)-dependent oxidoreductase [Solirubrobacterales bacterium]